jgi:hypothetical protein
MRLGLAGSTCRRPAERSVERSAEQSGSIANKGVNDGCVTSTRIRGPSCSKASAKPGRDYHFRVPPRSIVTTEVEPDYFQFYARRANAEWASDKTTEAGYEAHLWSNGGFVTIGTARKFGTTAVTVEVWDRPPNQPDEQW